MYNIEPVWEVISSKKYSVVEFSTTDIINILFLYASLMHTPSGLPHALLSVLSQLNAVV